MESLLVTSVISPSFPVPSDLLAPSASLPFISGLLFLLEIPPDDPYPILDLLTKSLQSTPPPLHASALALKLFTFISQLTQFPTPFEEAKCVILVKKALLALPSLDAVPTALRGPLASAIAKAVSTLISTLSGGKPVQDLTEAISQRYDFLGQTVLIRLSPRSVQFVTGKDCEDIESRVGEIASVCQQSTLLADMLYLRLYSLAQSRDAAKSVRKGLKSVETVFTSKRLSLLRSLLGADTASDTSSIVADKFQRIYSLIRRDLSNDKHVEVDQIAYELREMTVSGKDKSDLYQIAVDLMRRDEANQLTALIWKLILFGMHTIRLYSGKQWGDINEELNLKFGGGRKEAKGWKKVEKAEKGRREDEKVEEIQAERTVNTETNREQPGPSGGSKKGKGWKKMEKRPPISTEAKHEHPTPALLPPPPSAQAANDDFNPLLNPWDLPSVDTPSKKPEKHTKTKNKK